MDVPALVAGLAGSASARDAAATADALRRLADAVRDNAAAKTAALSCTDALPTLVRLLDESSHAAPHQVALLAAHVVALLGYQTGAAAQRALVAAGVLPPLVGLLRPGAASATAGAAAKALWVLLYDRPEHQHLVAALGALPLLVALLHGVDRDADTARAAAGAIERAALTDAALRLRAVRAGALPPLVRMLGDGRTLVTTICPIRKEQCDLTGRAAHAVWALVQDEDAANAEDARDLGALPPLVALVAETADADAVPVKAAVGALLALSGTETLHVALRDAGALAAARRAVRDTTRSDTRLLSLLLISCLQIDDDRDRAAGVQDDATGDGVAALLARHGVADQLVTLLRSTIHGDGYHADAWWSVAQAAHHARSASVAASGAEALASAGAAPLLVELLCSKRAEHTRARRDAAAALLNMAYVNALLGTLRAAGVHAAATAAAQAADERTADAAGGILRELARSGNAGATASSGTAPYDVFLSHKRTDAKDFVRGLYNTLTELGLRVFLDFECLVDIDGVTATAAAAHNLVFVLTDNVFESMWCIRELAAAAEAGRNIVLVLRAGARWRDPSGAPVRERAKLRSFPPAYIAISLMRRRAMHNSTPFRQTASWRCFRPRRALPSYAPPSRKAMDTTQPSKQSCASAWLTPQARRYSRRAHSVAAAAAVLRHRGRSVARLLQLNCVL